MPAMVRASPGIIPALAGNTPRVSFQAPCVRDHPRSRGEYLTLGAVYRNEQGSSPLSRGIQTHDDGHRSQYGIIPALAGNTMPSGNAVSAHGDHPRSRGEYVVRVSLLQSERGSSPLSRGIPGCLPALVDPGRIIPALAGNTCRRHSTDHSGPDHPRSRGEYFTTVPDQSLMSGSSPLSRGIPAVRTESQQSPWIIPALAGNTLGQHPFEIQDTDHPRSRGEYGRHPRGGRARWGSSPLSRGIRDPVTRGG